MNEDRKIIGNTLWIISCRIGQAVLQLLLTLFTARYLGPSNYGILNYAIALISFLSPVMQLGLSSVIVYELLIDPEEEGAILGTSIGLSLGTALLCIIGVTSFTAIAERGNPEVCAVTILYSLILIVEAVKLLQYWFQAKLLSKYTSLTMLAAYIAMSIYQIYILATGKSIAWFAFAKTFDIFIIDIVLLVLYQRMGGLAFRFSRSTAKRLLKKSKHYILPNMMGSIFEQADRIMLKIMVGAASTGIYTAATTCAGMAGFVFSAILESVRPSIFLSKRNDTKEYERKMIQLFSVVTCLAVCFSVGITICAPLAIKIMYGSAYEDAILPLRISVWATTFSYIGAVRNVWILAEEKQKILWKIYLFGALTNVLLNALFIPIWSASGAALATILTQFFTNVLFSFINPELRPVAFLMLKSFNLRNIFE